MVKPFDIRVEQINNELPQTQCQLCTYSGCKPYAEAIVNGDRIDRCLPGGVRVLEKLAQLTHQDSSPYLDDMEKKAKPRLLAIIREEECIGCTKCIQACPVDAILGASKLMHTVIASECTGCELCIEPCPVDCIDLITLGHSEDLSLQTLKEQAAHARTRYEFRKQRLTQQKKQARKKHQQAKQLSNLHKVASLEEKQAFIQAALIRKLKKC